MTAHTRLSYLLELADKGPAMRTALAEEVAELLMQWPPDYPAEMRTICETLLARAVRDIDADTRSRLRVLLCADASLAARVLPREIASRSLIDAARLGENIQDALARCLNVSPARATEILADDSCGTLAIAVRGAGIDRTTFSTLAVLVAKGRGPALDMWDAVDSPDAARRLQAWRNESAAAA